MSIIKVRKLLIFSRNEASLELVHGRSLLRPEWFVQIAAELERRSVCREKPMLRGD